jgi:hypothetical protein
MTMQPFNAALRRSEEFDKESERQFLVGEAILPEQFYASPYSTFAKRPEVLLMQAVLEDAFACFQGQFISTSTRNLRLAREAEIWFSSNATDSPFTFVNICTIFGLDPAYVRRGLKQWHSKGPLEIRRRKRRVVMTRPIVGLAA